MQGTLQGRATIQTPVHLQGLGQKGLGDETPRASGEQGRGLWPWGGRWQCAGAFPETCPGCMEVCGAPAVPSEPTQVVHVPKNPNLPGALGEGTEEQEGSYTERVKQQSTAI